MAARTKNFTQSETDYLLQLANKYKNVIECRETDKASNEKKENAWEKIEVEFNTNNIRNIYRDKNTLRTKFRNLKKDLKRQNTNKKLNIKDTGGGSPNQCCEQTTEEQLCDIKPEIEVADSFGIPESEKTTEEDPADVVPVFEIKLLQDETACNPTTELPSDVATTSINWDTLEPSKQNSTNNKKLYTDCKCKKHRKSSWDKLATIKGKLSKVKHRTEIQIMNDEHVQRMRVMKAEHVKRIEQMELDAQKTKLEIEILKKQLSL